MPATVVAETTQIVVPMTLLLGMENKLDYLDSNNIPINALYIMKGKIMLPPNSTNELYLLVKALIPPRYSTHWLIVYRGYNIPDLHARNKLHQPLYTQHTCIKDPPSSSMEFITMFILRDFAKIELVQQWSRQTDLREPIVPFYDKCVNYECAITLKTEL